MAKKKGIIRARKVKVETAKAEHASMQPAHRYMGQISGMRLGIKLPGITTTKTQQTKTRPGGRPASAESNLMSRIDFLKVAMAVVATIGTTTVLGGIAKAQGPPPSNEELSKTLAAMVDTLVPGVAGDPVIVVVIDQGNGQPTGETVSMPNLGAPPDDPDNPQPWETTQGAAFLPQISVPPYVLPPSYVYFYTVAQQMTGNTGINQIIASVLDQFAASVPIPLPPGYPYPAWKFMDLPYAARVQIFSMMDNPGFLITQLHFPPEQAMQTKSLLGVILIGGNYIYYSELCNLIPSGFPGRMPSYTRNPDNKTWPIIPNGAWYQMGYPGPITGERNYQSPYQGLKVCVINGEVKFGADCGV